MFKRLQIPANSRRPHHSTCVLADLMRKQEWKKCRWNNKNSSTIWDLMRETLHNFWICNLESWKLWNSVSISCTFTEIQLAIDPQANPLLPSPSDLFGYSKCLVFLWGFNISCMRFHFFILDTGEKKISKFSVWALDILRVDEIKLLPKSNS